MADILPQSTSTVSQQIADFIAKTERLSTNLSENFQQQVQVSRQAVDQQMNDLHQKLIDIRAVMTRTGNDQFLQDTQELSQNMDQTLQQLMATYQQINAQINAQCEQLNQAGVALLKQVSLTTTPLKSQALEILQQQKMQIIEQQSRQTVDYVKRFAKRFRWQNFIGILLLTFITALITSLYIDDKWPWEIHQKAEQQRQLGENTLKKWHQLNQEDQHRIMNYA